MSRTQLCSATGIWQAADKIVYSATLQAPDTARTRVERDFDPAQVRKLKEAVGRDLTVGGAHLAAQAIAAVNTSCSSSRPSSAAAPGPCPIRSA